MKDMSIDKACEKAGISRPTYYRWKDDLTPTDKEAEERKPGCHKFTEVKERKCVNCDKKFKTGLAFSRYCKYECRWGKQGE